MPLNAKASCCNDITYAFDSNTFCAKFNLANFDSKQYNIYASHVLLCIIIVEEDRIYSPSNTVMQWNDRYIPHYIQQYLLLSLLLLYNNECAAIIITSYYFFIIFIIIIIIFVGGKFFTSNNIVFYIIYQLIQHWIIL